MSKVFAHSLVQELALLLTIKLIVIVLAALFVFNGDHRPHIDSSAVEERLLSAP